jgi:hypothetical protein
LGVQIPAKAPPRGPESTPRARKPGPRIDPKGPETRAPRDAACDPKYHKIRFEEDFSMGSGCPRRPSQVCPRPRSPFPAEIPARKPDFRPGSSTVYIHGPKPYKFIKPRLPHRSTRPSIEVHDCKVVSEREAPRQAAHEILVEPSLVVLQVRSLHARQHWVKVLRQSTQTTIGDSGRCTVPIH